jgi:hypothetical protein
MGADAVVRFVANVTVANTQLAVLSSNLQLSLHASLADYGQA